MTRLKWGNGSERTYETGVDRGILYPNSGIGVAWNGLISMNEVSESEEIPRYVDGLKLRSKQGSGGFSATLEAFTYPDEFLVYDGTVDRIITQQRHKSFGLCYRTKIGNAVDGLDGGYKIHIVYNALASPTEKSYASINNSSEAITFSWGITTTPKPIQGAKACAHFIIDTSKAHTWTIEALEDALYGSDSVEPTLPSPNAIFAIFEANALFTVTDNGDGTFTVTGPDEQVQMLDATTFQITSQSAIFINETSYRISSL